MDKKDCFKNCLNLRHPQFTERSIKRLLSVNLQGFYFFNKEPQGGGNVIRLHVCISFILVLNYSFLQQVIQYLLHQRFQYFHLHPSVFLHL